MSAPVILLLTPDADVERLAAEAVLATRHGLRVRRNCPDAIRELREGCSDIDLVIVDLDPGVHGTALLEATGEWRPVIALSSLEEAYLAPMSRRHGARACLAKPFSAAQLRAAIDEVLQSPGASEPAIYS